MATSDPYDRNRLPPITVRGPREASPPITVRGRAAPDFSGTQGGFNSTAMQAAQQPQRPARGGVIGGGGGGGREDPRTLLSALGLMLRDRAQQQEALQHTVPEPPPDRASRQAPWLLRALGSDRVLQGYAPDEPSGPRLPETPLGNSSALNALRTDPTGMRAMSSAFQGWNRGGARGQQFDNVEGGFTVGSDQPAAPTEDRSYGSGWQDPRSEDPDAYYAANQPAAQDRAEPPSSLEDLRAGRPGIRTVVQGTNSMDLTDDANWANSTIYEGQRDRHGARTFSNNPYDAILGSSRELSDEEQATLRGMEANRQEDIRLRRASREDAIEERDRERQLAPRDFADVMAERRHNANRDDEMHRRREVTRLERREDARNRRDAEQRERDGQISAAREMAGRLSAEQAMDATGLDNPADAHNALVSQYLSALQMDPTLAPEGVVDNTRSSAQLTSAMNAMARFSTPFWNRTQFDNLTPQDVSIDDRGRFRVRTGGGSGGDPEFTTLRMNPFTPQDIQDTITGVLRRNRDEAARRDRTAAVLGQGGARAGRGSEIDIPPGVEIEPQDREAMQKLRQGQLSAAEERRLRRKYRLSNYSE